MRLSQDSNHKEIRDHVVNRRDCVAWDMFRAGGGLPDLLVWDKHYSGFLWIVEIKVIPPLKRRAIARADAVKRLTAAEALFHEALDGCPNIALWWSTKCADAAIDAAREATCRLWGHVIQS